MWLGVFLSTTCKLPNMFKCTCIAIYYSWHPGSHLVVSTSTRQDLMFIESILSLYCWSSVATFNLLNHLCVMCPTRIEDFASICIQCSPVSIPSLGQQAMCFFHVLYSFNWHVAVTLFDEPHSCFEEHPWVWCGSLDPEVTSTDTDKGSFPFLLV